MRHRVRLIAAAAFLLVTQGCASYAPALTRLYPDDRIRVRADSPFAVVLANRDRVATSSCYATAVIGRVLDVRGDTLVVGGAPHVVPVAGGACPVSETAIFVAPPRVADVEVRHIDQRKTLVALGATAFVLDALYELLKRAFPPT